MRIGRDYLKWVASVLLVALAVAGCPTTRPAYTPAIILSTRTLDFGKTLTSLTFTVSNVWTSVPMPEFTVTSDQPWATASPTTGKSTGPDDPVTITVTIDRSMMIAGSHTATIYVTAPGIVRNSVAVLAEAQLTATFSVDNTQPFAGQLVTFTDASSAAPGQGPITSWLWDFGDGGTSTDQNPVRSYAFASTYTVRLTVTTANLSATTTRIDYMVVRVRVGPTAEFTASTTKSLATFTSVQFTDLSTPGTVPIANWFWDFGDGSPTSSAQHPSHTYTVRAIHVLYFDVLLRVTTPHGVDEELKLGYIELVPAPPQADFFSSTQNPEVNSVVQFIDISEPGSGDITSWLWEFGDIGDTATSTAQHPAHTYTAIGTYSVKLTVTTAVGSADVTKEDYITVVAIPPTAQFSATPLNPALGVDEVEFTDLSIPGSAPITNWLWNFGDGATSTEQNAKHNYTAYTEYGYTVKLTVTTSVRSHTEEKRDYIVPPALDRYLAKPNPDYNHEVQPGFPANLPVALPRANVWVVRLTSQSWMPNHVTVPANNGLWEHWLTIAQPTTKSLSDTAMLIISGGDTDELDVMPDPGSAELATFAQTAVNLGSTIALLEQVPNQPLTFDYDVVTPSAERSEDEIIAYTFDRFIKVEDRIEADEWPALLPMTKSAVTAMDAIQELVPEIEKFVVTGASKRGWTTWLTGAADPKARVVGIMPMVIDMLNMRPSFIHHYRCYGEYSEQIEDYDSPANTGNPISMDVIQYVNGTNPDPVLTALGDDLLAIVDPYSYLARLRMPKYGINASGDQFFVPDSAQFYYDDMLQPMRLNYFPNVGHSLTSYEHAIGVASPVYISMAQGLPLPQITWSETYTGSGLMINVTPSTTPTVLSASLYTATTNAGFRNFRVEVIGDTAWTAAPLTPVGGVYSVVVPNPGPNQWTGAFVQVVFDSGLPGLPLVLTTQIYVTPDVYLYPAPSK